MRILCQCGAASIIHRVNALSNSTDTELMCSCTDPECGHSFISGVSYKHATKPSRLTLDEPVKIGASVLPVAVARGR
ncbi:transcriptional regulator [Veronia nyctiphanis]|uniref:Transcriptional regulator n=1 Tax=Veronia nyctiphanis TaxID=1278244 RepID=A0A4Q0YM32_9GAMM|nr:ogr/Delta-like zinc finger family protein [Veronia nyctiphanis]RXJ71766.1 transcriptional regulator [Veronia nyctiphanis]